MAIRFTIAAIAPRTGSTVFSAPLQLYRDRLAPFAEVDLTLHPTEAALFDALLRPRPAAGQKNPPMLVLLDSRGKSLSSESFAAWLGQQRDAGRQSIAFAIGPASGWSDEARHKAGLLLSLGPMTLPHQLARVVLLEQLYRAFTILTGHPYHSGH